jgi:hypothetical protein
MVQFLKTFEGLLGTEAATNYSLGFQFFSCLNELVHEETNNQLQVMNDQVITPINRILGNDFGGSPKVLEVKIKVLEFLLRLVEQPQARVITKMAATLSLNHLAKNTNALTQPNPSEQAILLGSLSYRLIKILADSDKTGLVKYSEQLEVVENNCRSSIGRIEIINDTGKLERVYYPIPPYFKKQTEEERKELVREQQRSLDENLLNWRTNWKTSTDKIENFGKWAEFYIAETEHRLDIQKNVLKSFVATNSKWWNRISFVLSFVINFIILFTATGQGISYVVKEERGRFYCNTVEALIRACYSIAVESPIHTQGY